MGRTNEQKTDDDGTDNEMDGQRTEDGDGMDGDDGTDDGTDGQGKPTAGWTRRDGRAEDGRRL